MVMALSLIKQRYVKIFRDIKSDPYDHKKILLPFLLLIVFPLIFVITPAIFILFWMVFLFPKFFLLSNVLCLVFSCIAVIIGWFCKKRRLKLWKVSFWFASIFGGFWMASFMSGAIYAFAAHSGVKMVSFKARFPMGDITSIDLDGEGRIYCADSSRCRLQIFDNEGEFLKGWFVPISGGDIYVSIENNRHLRVDNFGFKKSSIYDLNGKLLSVKEGEIDPKFSSSNELEVVDSLGSKYKAVKNLFTWKIVKINRNGEQTLVSDPFILSILATPFPVFGFIVFSIVLIGFTHSLLLKAKRDGNSDLPEISSIPELEKEELLQDKIGEVNCLCEKINFMDGLPAHDYAKDHLKVINVIDGGRQVEYFCPYTGKRWLMDFTQETGANQVSYSRLRSIPKKR